MKTQIALDYFEMDPALSLAKSVVDAGADFLEVGTPLLAGEGMGSVTRIKETFPDKRVVADFKTMDGGGIFAEKAAGAGADVTTVMGLAEDATLRAAIEAAEKHGIQVEVDLLGMNEDRAVNRAVQAQRMGADIIMVHTAIDKIWANPDENPVKLVPSVVEAVDLPVSVACVNAEFCGRAREAGASIAVVGPGDLDPEPLVEFVRTVGNNE